MIFYSILRICRLAKRGHNSLDGTCSVALLALFLLVTGAVLVPPVHAQARITGVVTGTVVDPSGAAIPGAILKLTDPSTGFTQTVTASASGVYVFPALQPGTYAMQAAAQGFAKALYSSVTVNAGQTTDITINMKIGTASQKITVSAKGQILKTSSARLSTTISPKGVENLPLSGLNALPLATLVAGATTAEGNTRYTTFDGLPAAALNISVNGTNDNIQRYRSTTTGFFTAAPLRLGAFDEFTVSTSDLTAEAGAQGSSTLQFVTKRGTNHFHGNLFWWAENSYFNANDYRNNAIGLGKASQHLNDFGGSIGGPILKNKLFFFGYLEYRRDPTAFTDTSQVLTPSAQAGNFTYLGTDGNLHTINLLNLAQNYGFNSNVNSVSGNILGEINQYVPNGALSAGKYNTGAVATPVTQTLSWLQPRTYKYWWPTVRLDYQITPKLSWSGSWDAQWYTITAFPSYPGAQLAGNQWWSSYYTMGNSLNWVISPALLNQFHFGLEEVKAEFNGGTTGDPFASQNDQVITPPLGVAPVIPSFILPNPRNNPTYNPEDDLTWTHGNHTFTFGGQMQVGTMYATTVNNPPAYHTGIVNQDPAATMFSSANFPDIKTLQNNAELDNAKALYAFLTGRISSISGSNGVNSATGQYQLEGRTTDREKLILGGIYFQDAWRVTQHLALNYGFRWQFTGALGSTNNLWTSPTYAGLLGPSAALFEPGVLNGDYNPQIYLRPHPYKADLVQPAPNFGIAWNPDFETGLLHKLFGSNTVFSGGASVSRFDEGWAAVENTNYSGNPGTTQKVFYNAVTNFPPGTLSLGQHIVPNVFPTSFNFPVSESAFTFTNTPFSTVNPNITSPYVEAWNVGIQRQFRGNNVLQINYVGNHAVGLWMSYDLNTVNIFGNGFLTDFHNAARNLATNQANGYGATFADSTGAPGLLPTPIFDTAFSGQHPSAGFANPTFVTLLQQGQAGALAAKLAGTYTYLCNLVGGNTSFTPCAGSGGTGQYPINMFQANPYAAGSYLDYLSNPGQSTYSALQVQWKHPTGYGLMLMANYTWAHSLSNVYIGQFNGGDQLLQNFVSLSNMNLNKGPGPYDIRQAFKLYSTYALPFGPGRQFTTSNSFMGRAIGDVIGGWTVGTIFTAQTGLPFKLMGGYNTYNYSYASWPDASDSGVVLNGVTVDQLQNNVGDYSGPTTSEPVVFLNPTLLAQNPNAIAPETTPGQLGQMIYLHAPSAWDVDLSLLKAIPFRGNMSLDVRAEFINAFNHPNWGVPGPDGISPADYMNVSGFAFTQADELSSPRQIQFRVNLNF